ncbi:MAG TPA: sensor histidine kinase [Puia sp.]|uniref:sensor histidine kinase n=1 Tax=Puia sp. TaxID=2045100 RepID=UPI002B8F5367|nr:sensor histidine kinase [Puia sp.]HVU98103.1 sensor histidine kinase [Puia sp.]
MEYDNDRLRKRRPRLETFYWIFLILLQPMTNWVLSPFRWLWIFLLIASLLVFPAYVIYTRIMGTALAIRGRKWFPVLLSISAFLVIQAFLLCVYSLFGKILEFPMKEYFAMTSRHMIREGWWTIANMTLAMAIFYIRKADDEKDQLEAMQKDNTFFKLRYLRAQLNPHFLFNTLNSIYSLSLQKSDRTAEIVVKLADIMRYLIYECNEDKIPLDKEIEFIRNYIEIEKLRHQADIRLVVEGETAGLMIEPFLFISFIENGFKHAMDHTSGEPFIYITLRVANGQLILNVINSTNTDLELQAKKLNGMGMAHSRSLLELLYPSSYDLDIIQTDKDESRTSQLRLRNARERLESLYPDSHTLDVILNKSTFTVSLILKTFSAC